MSDSISIARRLIATTTDLPVLDPVVTRVLQLVSDLETDPSDLAREITRDPSLSARVLKLSNSAMMGLPRKVDTLERAILTLGFQEIRNLVLLTATYDFVSRGTDQRLFVPLWEHFITVAISARFIAELWVPETRDHAHLAGLMHDLGKVVFAIRFPDQYVEILLNRDNGPGESLEHEMRLFGCNHQQLGRIMLEEWNFPEVFVEVAGDHHGTTDGNGSSVVLSEVIELSDLLAYVIRGRSISPEHALELLQALNIPRDGWLELPDRVRERIQIERDALERP